METNFIFSNHHSASLEMPLVAQLQSEVPFVSRLFIRIVFHSLSFFLSFISFSPFLLFAGYGTDL